MRAASGPEAPSPRLRGEEGWGVPDAGPDPNAPASRIVGMPRPKPFAHAVRDVEKLPAVADV